MIDKITIAVADMDSMATFYSATLSLAFVDVDLMGHTLKSARDGELEIMLCPKELAGIEAKINTIQVRFLVPDVRGAYARGLVEGGKDLGEPTELQGCLQASLRDPDGNSLELKQTAT
ncbi:MAG: putative enzyme related to lactoylglutathione lyase [Candidatus Paceibacteria bacterium]|jgi:predicted enzyme related to lactoylglutathione lyase